jgi:agmatine/peptidylarginine deiminase
MPMQTFGSTSANRRTVTKGYFAHLERMLREELGVAQITWRTKSNYSAPADAAIVDEIKRWQAVVCSGCRDTNASRLAIQSAAPRMPMPRRGRP